MEYALRTPVAVVQYYITVTFLYYPRSEKMREKISYKQLSLQCAHQPEWAQHMRTIYFCFKTSMEQ